MLQKKRETEARLLWANKPDKLQQAKEEISEVRNFLLDMGRQVVSNQGPSQARLGAVSLAVQLPWFDGCKTSTMTFSSACHPNKPRCKVSLYSNSK